MEAAGARAVPIHYTADEATLQTLAASVNGILLPGGGVSLSNTSTYYKAGKTLYDAAVKFNDAGHPYPIWGTCLGALLAPPAETIDPKTQQDITVTGRLSLI